MGRRLRRGAGLRLRAASAGSRSRIEAACGQQGEDLRDAVDDLGDREDVLAARRPGGGGAPGLGEEEDAPADQGVPVLGRGGLGGEQQVGPLVGRGPGARGLVAPLADDVGPVGLPLPRRPRRPGRRRGSRAIDRRSGSTQVGGCPVEPVVDQVEPGGGLGGGELGLAPPVRDAGDRDLQARPAEGVGQAFHWADSTACQTAGRPGRRPSRVRSAGPRRDSAGSALGGVEQVEQRELAGERDPGQRRVVAEGQAGLGVDVGEQGLGRLAVGLRGSSGSKAAAGPPPGGSWPALGDVVAVAEPPAALELDRDVDAPRLQGGDQVVEPGQGVGVERLGVVAGVVEEAPAGAERGVEVAEPDEVHARAGQAVGQGVGPAGVREGGRRQERDAEEPGPAPLGEGQPAVLDGRRSPCLPAGASSRNEASSAEPGVDRRRAASTGSQPRGLVLDVVRGPGPRRRVGRGGHGHVVEPEGARRRRPSRTGGPPGRRPRGRGPTPCVGRQSKVPDQREDRGPLVGPGQGPAVVVEEEDDAPRPRSPREARRPGRRPRPPASANGCDRDAPGRSSPRAPARSARGRRPTRWPGKTRRAPFSSDPARPGRGRPARSRR